MTTEKEVKKPARGYSDEIKNAAKIMYIRRHPVRVIKEELGINSERVIYQWASKGEWDNMLHHETVEEATSRKLITLIEKSPKNDADYKEIEQLSNLLDKLAGIDIKKAKALKEKAQAVKVETEGRDVKSRRSKRNEISSITADALENIRNTLFYDYQNNWFANRAHKRRFILKSRQIGATFYFAFEAFERAIVDGENCIFISASRAQANIFKAYIFKFAKEYFDVELKGGDVIELQKDGKPHADLRFVSTNARTAQGFNGHLYFDEVFWTYKFEEVEKYVGGGASHKQWTKTYFSTPSVKSHSAYRLYSGERYNERRKNKVEFDLSHAALKQGAVGADKMWRNIVTVKDAEAGGCDLFDIEQLMDEYSQAEFDNLFMCHFMEAGLSVFSLSKLLSCQVDSDVLWVDFKNKKLGYQGPVWIGYDPARKGDKSSVTVLAVPKPEYPKFRILEKLQLRGTYEHQADAIEQLVGRYNVKFIGIDSTGQGLGVYERVKSFFRNTEAINYTVESKTRLVQKGISVVESGRIEWDAEHVDVAQAFLQIRQTTTANDSITYVSNRKEETGHADVAWSVLHALSNEPLVKRKKASVGM